MTSSKPVNCARRLAGQWGEVQRQHKLADGIWEFSCSGHGGIVVDLDVYPEFSEWRDFVPLRNSGEGRFRGYQHEQHFAAFEEDCDWAIPYAFHFDLLASERNWRGYVKECERYGYAPSERTESYRAWRSWMRGLVNDAIRRYHGRLVDEGRVRLEDEQPVQLALAM